MSVHPMPKNVNKVTKVRRNKIKCKTKRLKGKKKKELRKWKFLEHRGPVFAPSYKTLPSGINFKYHGKPVKLQPASEEVMTFYAKWLKVKCTKNKTFLKNFFQDWRSVMNNRERNLITDFNKCDFKEVHEYLKLVAAKNRLEKRKHGFCNWDGKREKLNNFRLEPPGLFKGSGNHPKMGKLKRRVCPEDVIINCSRDAVVPTPPAGHGWKEVRHDDQVTWLASWKENVFNKPKYIYLNQSSKIRSEKDMEKYELARRLKSCIGRIRTSYMTDLKSEDEMVRQRAIALFFIDKLALRAGNEKEAGETADTVGCCSLRCEHVKLVKKLNTYYVWFNFPGKHCVQYRNKIEVPISIYRSLAYFKHNKLGSQRLFDLINTNDVNKYLNFLMRGLTAKVFRTYNASITFQRLLKRLNNSKATLTSKLLSYNRANRAVALLCNHQKAPPKNFRIRMSNIHGKIRKKEQEVMDCREEIQNIRKRIRKLLTNKEKEKLKMKKKKLEKLEIQLNNIKAKATDAVENKVFSLATSKLNYIDPRITVAWCLKHQVPIEKVYNKTQRERFSWAISKANRAFVF